MTLVPVRRLQNEWRSPFDEFDRLVDAWSRFPARHVVREGLWHPPTDIYDQRERLVVELELPGIKADEVNISIQEDHLIVEGERKRNGSGTQDELFYSERDFGGFHRIVHLPASVDPDATTAKYKDGVLTVTLPKKERERGKKVEVES
ncbi:MAG: Hsp20/alpha crystallin family protein [Kiritimatiellae bacterium]|nr:Hsp20/alpha crystallin family protein [Kiritimatiellia bacterium]